MIVSTLIISCSHLREHNYHTSYKAPRPVHTLIENEASLAIAIGVKSERPFVIDSLRGKKQPPCLKKASSNNYTQAYKGYSPRKEASECKTKTLSPGIELEKSIRETQIPIQGIIYKDGKKISVKFHRVLIAAYEGSNCSTIYSGGVEYQRCVSQQETCDTYRQDLDFLSLEEFLSEEPKCRGLVTQ